MGVEGRPWTPDEQEPAGGWPPAPDAIPIVVRAWRLTESGEARPDPPTTGGFAASLKSDVSRSRAWHFAEAWRLIRERGSAWASDPKAVRMVSLSGVLVPVRKGRRRLESWQADRAATHPDDP
jgi:hypothetical protein